MQQKTVAKSSSEQLLIDLFRFEEILRDNAINNAKEAELNYNREN